MALLEKEYMEINILSGWLELLDVYDTDLDS